MTTSESTKAMSAPSGDFAQTVRRYLADRRLLLAVAIVALVAGAVFNWGWLVALGIAPVLISLLPCVVMCGVGIGCMKMMGGSGANQAGQSGSAPGTAESFWPSNIVNASSPRVPDCCGHGDGAHTSTKPEASSITR